MSQRRPSPDPNPNPNPYTPQNPAASPGQTSKRDISKGPITWPPPGKYFASPFLALLMRKKPRNTPKGAAGRGKCLKVNQPKPGTVVCSHECWEELSVCCTNVATRFICQENLLEQQLSVG